MGKIEGAVIQTSDHSAERPVAVQYVVTFLKPEMLHVYRQITGLRTFRPIVFCQKREHAADFPFEPVIQLPKPRTHALRRVWQKQILGQPITIYRSEARRILARLHEVKATVLHVYFGHIGMHLLPLLEICDLPVMVSFHGADAQVGMENPKYQMRMQRVLERCTLVLARSQSLADRLVALGAEPTKIRLHRTGIPLEQIRFVQRRVPADGRWHLVQACRLIAKKGLRTTLRAFASFHRHFPAATLTIAGEGPQLAELQAECRSLAIGDAVHFPGFLAQRDLRDLFEKAHFFLHPSELAADGDQEGVPNSMLEAMAAGVPAVATYHGGIPEAVEDGISGYLVEERDDAALAAAMQMLASDPGRYEAMSRAAHERVSAEFALEAQTRCLEGFYREAISAAARVAPCCRPLAS